MGSCSLLSFSCHSSTTDIWQPTAKSSPPQPQTPGHVQSKLPDRFFWCSSSWDRMHTVVYSSVLDAFDLSHIEPFCFCDSFLLDLAQLNITVPTCVVTLSRTGVQYFKKRKSLPGSCISANSKNFGKQMGMKQSSWTFRYVDIALLGFCDFGGVNSSLFSTLVLTWPLGIVRPLQQPCRGV